MSMFWLFAAILSLAAIGFIAPPLLGRRGREHAIRDEVNAEIYRERLANLEREYSDQDDATKEEAKRELLHEFARQTGDPRDATIASASAWPATAVTLSALVPVAAFVGYIVLGEPGLMIPSAASTEPAMVTGMEANPGAAQPQSAPPLGKMIAGLEERLQANPADVEGWLLLARSYGQLDQQQRARAALGRGLQANRDDLDLTVALAETTARIQGNKFVGEPVELLRTVLARAPGHRKALWLTGIGELQGDNPAQALLHWERLQAAGHMEAEDAALLGRFIAQARAQMSEEPRSQSPAAAASRPSTATTKTGTSPSANPNSGIANASAPRESGNVSGTSIAVSVEIEASKLSNVSPQDTVFVFARAAQGPRMPLAIARRTVADLPFEVTLDDSMAMMPALKLSGFTQVIIGARVSKTGNAMPAPGDLSGSHGPLSPSDTAKATVVINRVVQ
jgi:cytochrome c-type biogenesis protein CcmH